VRLPAAIYHRVSTVDQNPTAARAELRAAAEQRGYEVVLTVDETGSGENSDRPGLDRVMAAARRGQLRAVFVWALDRFGRSPLDLEINTQRLLEAGCSWICVSQPIELHPKPDPASLLTFRVMSAVSAWERETIAARTRDALRRKREAGAKLGRPGKQPPIAVVVKLRDVRRLEWSKIASMLRVSVSTVRRAYRSAKQTEDQTDGSES
jgi:putative DNA-invertase from lambdoid prophage Rac